MSCPDRFEIFLAVEEGSSGLDAHLASCEKCRALADAERSLGASLSRVVDPAPPAGVLEAALSRIDARRAEAAVTARQTTLGLVGALVVVATVVALTWQGLLVDAAGSAASFGTVVATLVRALGPVVSKLAPAIVTAQALLMLAAAATAFKLLSPGRVRS